MRFVVVVAAVAGIVACGKSGRTRDDAPHAARPRPADAATVPAPAPAAASYPDLAAALAATIPSDARVVGFGELHMRTDRAQVRSTLARFTADALPALADKLSDLIVETWVVDGQCGSAAREATAKVEITSRRPQETKSDITALAEAARAAKIQPHAMKMTCADYARIAPPGKDMNAEELLAFVTRELARIAVEAVRHRDREPGHRPWIAVYGGAVHNDRFPEAGTEPWSYADAVDRATRDHFVEIDLIVPELAAADPVSKRQPWFPLVRDADRAVHVYTRGARSFVIVLPRSAR